MISAHFLRGLPALALTVLVSGCVQPKASPDPAPDAELVVADAEPAADAEGAAADAAVPADGSAQADAQGLSPDAAAVDRAPDPVEVAGVPADAAPVKLDTAFTGASLGTGCQRGSDCLTGFCADGVCCNEACTGQCAACAQPGNLGTCLPATGAPRGQRPACLGTGTCAGACDGKDPAACRYPGASVTCGTASCSAGVATPAATCDGKGACGTPAPITCAPDPCDGTACGQCSATRPCAEGFQCLGGKCEPKLDAGKSCQGAGQCKSGHCQQDVCCDRPCTGACESCSVPGSVGRCTFVTGKTCRASTGLCDVAELCDGSSGSCPADARQPSGTTCRAAAGLCDQAETCDGQAADCPGDFKRPGGSTCRAVAGACDVAETCDGSSNLCPGDVRLPSTVPCRPVMGPCDLAESCDGQSAACPADGRRSSSYVCRAAAGTCDAVETCDGQSVACPGDLKSVNGVECRASTGLSDPAELCDGNANSCPSDVKYSNYVKNGEFNSGLTGWDIFSDNASIDTGGKLSGTNSIKLAVKMNDFFTIKQDIGPLQAGLYYTVGFRARASQPTSIRVWLSSESYKVDLTTSDAQYGPFFLAADATDLLDFRFQSGDETTATAYDVWIDRVEVYRP